MVDFLTLPLRPAEGQVHVVVESPRGSRVKLKYDPKLGVFTLGRPLVLGVSYPFEWGFIPSTRAPDGDPLDAMVLFDAPTFPGVVLACVPIGVVKVSQVREGGGRERNDRLIAVAAGDRRSETLRDARRLPARVREELEQFFVSAVLLEGKGIKLLGWGGPKSAQRLVESCVERAPRP